MDAMRMIMESKQRDVNPFRELLKQMGAFGGPNLQELGGVGQQGQPAMPSQGAQMQKMIAALIAKGMPQEQAIATVKKQMERPLTGGGEQL